MRIRAPSSALRPAHLLATRDAISGGACLCGHQGALWIGDWVAGGAVASAKKKTAPLPSSSLVRQAASRRASISLSVFLHPVTSAQAVLLRAGRHEPRERWDALAKRFNKVTPGLTFQLTDLQGACGSLLRRRQVRSVGVRPSIVPVGRSKRAPVCPFESMASGRE